MKRVIVGDMKRKCTSFRLTSLALMACLFFIASATAEEGRNASMRLPGMSDLMYAAWSGDLEGIERLVAEGADPDEADPDGDTALHWACRAGPLADGALGALIRLGAGVEVRNKAGQSPLHVAIDSGYAAAAIRLLYAGADHRIRFPGGRNALHAALLSLRERGWLWYGISITDDPDYQLCALLMEKGLSPIEPDDQGLSAYRFARGADAPSALLAALERRMSDLEREGETALIESLAPPSVQEEPPIAPGKPALINGGSALRIPILLGAAAGTALNIYVKEVVYRPNPQDNWLATVNAVIGLGTGCSFILGGIAFVSSYTFEGEFLMRRKGAKGWTAAGFILGALIGTVWALTPDARNAYATGPVLYYSVPIFIDLALLDLLF